MRNHKFTLLIGVLFWKCSLNQQSNLFFSDFMSNPKVWHGAALLTFLFLMFSHDYIILLANQFVVHLPIRENLDSKRKLRIIHKNTIWCICTQYFLSLTIVLYRNIFLFICVCPIFFAFNPPNNGVNLFLILWLYQLAPAHTITD